MIKKKLSYVLSGVVMISSLTFGNSFVNAEEIGQAPIATADDYSQQLTSSEQEKINYMVDNVSFDEVKNKLYIINKADLKKKDKKLYLELKNTVSKMNKVINSEEGQKLKEQALNELEKNSSKKVTVKKVGSCGKVTLAGFAHTTAFGGLMTAAAISGPAAWAIGSGVAAVWLGAGAAAGCLK